jgi:ketosteroid isomerase-like protein
VNLRETLERGDFEAFLAVLDPDVEWLGIDPEHQLCRNRDEVRRVFEDAMAAGHSGAPEVVAETDNAIVVDPHVDPPLPGLGELHHVFTVSGGKIVRMQDYESRATALMAVGLW